MKGEVARSVRMRSSSSLSASRNEKGGKPTDFKFEIHRLAPYHFLIFQQLLVSSLT